MIINKPKGCYDVIPVDNQKWLYLFEQVKTTFLRHNYEFIRTPLFESSNLFKRENENSDMVKKETYDFFDRSNRSFTLRPEATAGVVRAIIENKLYLDKFKNRFFYFGPCYRYERPQKGRFREFYQFGCEVIAQKDPYHDAAVIMLAKEHMDALNIKCHLHLNSLGGSASKKAYAQALANHFNSHKETLCSDCQARLVTNPLRIIDCKVDTNHPAMLSAPHALDYLDNAAKDYFLRLTQTLSSLGCEYQIDHKIVRGLDYYSDVVFEIIADETKMVLAGGGRYDNLIQELGGPALGAIGFAYGAERVISHLSFTPQNDYQIVLISKSENTIYAMQIARLLRHADYRLYTDYQDRNFSKKLKDALSLNPQYLLFIAEEENNTQTISVKDVKTNKQVRIFKKDLLTYLKGAK